MHFKTCFEVLKNSSALQQGELALSEEFVTAEVEKRLDTTLVRKIDLTFVRQHCVVDVNVGKARLLYRWASSFALRSFDLNTDDRHVLFEQAGKGRAGPANFAARAVRFAPSLIPGVGPLGVVIRVALDQLVEALLNSQVRSSAEESGFEVEPPLWRYDLSSGEWEGHPAFTPVELPMLGNWTLVGDVVVVRRVDLQNGEISLKLGVHPSFKKAASYFGFDWRKVAGNADLDSEKETAPVDADESKVPPSNMSGGLLNMISPAEQEISDLMREHESTPTAQVVDEEWRAELREAPALEPDDLNIDGAEALEVLDLLEL